MYKVNEIFYSLQGEGSRSGMPAVFIRLSGCNLKCPFCDTKHADYQERDLYFIVNLVAELLFSQSRQGGLVVITGGEPFLQNIVPLVRALYDLGSGQVIVEIETNGTLINEKIFDYPNVFVTCSPKTIQPVSDMVIDKIAQWKYIMSSDLELNKFGLPANVFSNRKIISCPEKVFIQPMDAGNVQQNEKNVRLSLAICLKFGYRLSLQLQKMLSIP